MFLAGAICVVLLAILYAYGVLQNDKVAERKKEGSKRPLVSSSAVSKLSNLSISAAAAALYQQDDAEKAFEEFLGESFGTPIDKHFYTRVAGVSYANSDGSSRQSLIQQCKERDRIVLVQEPECPYDSSAVRVENSSGSQLGYLPSNVSAERSGQIDQWSAVVRHVYRACEGKPAALVICMIRTRVEDISPRSVFEVAFKKVVGSHSDLHFATRMDRAFGLNEDGTDRQDLIGKCAPYDALYLRREPENERDTNSVRVCNEDGQGLGYLGRTTSAEIAPQMDAGRLWFAIVMGVEPTPAGKRFKLHLCVYRMTVEYAREILAK
jgi:hypothetical protein